MELIERHLLRWKRIKILLGSAWAMLALLGGLVILFLTFWFVYAIIWFISSGASDVWKSVFHEQLRFGHEMKLVCSALFIVLLFVQLFRTDPSYWSEYPKREYRADIEGSELFRHPHVAAKMTLDILLSGPRLVMGAWNSLRTVMEILRINTTAAASFVQFLLKQGQAVPYEELEDVGWGPWLPQMRRIEGLRFLENGVTLADDWRMELTSTEAWRTTR
jgi:hypothetical protein